MVVLFVHCIKKREAAQKDGFLNRLPLLPIPFDITNTAKVYTHVQTYNGLEYVLRHIRIIV